MKQLLIVFTILISHQSIVSQYGQEGAILAVGEGVTRAIEISQLNKAASVQDDIVLLHSAIAATTLEIVRVEQKLLDSQSDFTSWVGNLNSAITLGLTVEKLYRVNERLYITVSDNPLLLGIGVEALLGYILEAGSIIDDSALAFKTSDTNRLSNQERIEILLSCQDALDLIVNDAVRLLKALEDLAALNLDDNPVEIEFSVSLEEVLQAHQLRIDNLIIE